MIGYILKMIIKQLLMKYSWRIITTLKKIIIWKYRQKSLIEDAWNAIRYKEGEDYILLQ